MLPAFLLLFSVILLLVAGLDYSLGWLTLLALTPLLAYFDRALAAGWNRRRIVVMFWLSQLILEVWWLSFIIQTNPHSWASVHGLGIVIAQTFAWLFAAFMLSLPALGLGWLLTAPVMRRRAWLAGLTLAAGWVVLEYLHSVGLMVLAWGPEGSIGPYMNFGVLGLTASSSWLVYTGRYLGMYGLSFMIVLVNLGLWQLVRRRSLWGLALVIGLLGGSWGLATYEHSRPTQAAIKTGIIQLPDANRVDDDRLAELAGARMGTNLPLRLLVLPEYSQVFQHPDQRPARLVQTLFKGDTSGTIVDAGALTPNAREDYVRIFIRDGSGKLLETQRKRFLIPTGEYMPYILQFGLAAIGQQQTVDTYNYYRSVKRSPVPEHPVSHGGLSVGALACSGIMSPGDYRRLTSEGATVLTSNSSLNVLRNVPAFGQYAKGLLRFEAVANARPLVLAGRGSSSYIIDGDGTYRTETASAVLDAAAADIHPADWHTFYTQHGEFMLYLSLLITAAAIAASVIIKT